MERCGGIARFTAGRDAGNSLDPDGPAETELVTVDSLIGDRHVTGMKVDVEGFEIDVLSVGPMNANSPFHRAAVFFAHRGP